MEELAEDIILVIPGAAEFVGVARLVGSSLASRCGFTVEEIEDFRLAIDELCFSVTGLGDPEAKLELRYSFLEGGLAVEAAIEAADGTEPTVYANDLSERVLTALVDAHGIKDSEERRPVAWLRKTSSHKSS